MSRCEVASQLLGSRRRRSSWSLINIVTSEEIIEAFSLTVKDANNTAKGFPTKVMSREYTISLVLDIINHLASRLAVVRAVKYSTDVLAQDNSGATHTISAKAILVHDRAIIMLITMYVQTRRNSLGPHLHLYSCPGTLAETEAKPLNASSGDQRV